MKSFIALTILLLSHHSFASACLNHSDQESQRAEINKLISESKYCEIDSDCKLASLGCPFGCVTAINAANVQLVVSAANAYHDQSCTQCMYKCGHASKAECENQKCTVK